MKYDYDSPQRIVLDYNEKDRCTFCHNLYSCQFITDLRMFKEKSQYNGVNMSECELFVPTAQKADLPTDDLKSMRDQIFPKNEWHDYKADYNKGRVKDFNGLRRDSLE
jgi:hypothetical protein